MNIFEKAAEILAEKGHCKHTPQDENGAYCASGALHAAAGWRQGETLVGDYDSHAAYEAAKAAGQRLRERGDVPRQYPGPAFLDLVEWNNAPERTGEDVILLFKELAAEGDG